MDTVPERSRQKQAKSASPVSREKVISINVNWKDTLKRDENGHLTPCLLNAIWAFERAPELIGVIGRDIFSSRTVVRRAPPWSAPPIRSGSAPFPRDWTDHDTTRAAAWLQSEGLMVQREATNQASSAVAWMCPFHPVRDYLESLTWDGIERLDTWPSVYLGSDYIPITAQFGTRFLIAAVARIFEPGCKVDTTLILEGGQGKKKSSALEILAGQWFTDEIPDIRKKDGAMQLEGIWILEFAELEALEGPTADSSKKFLSRKVDRYRPVWGTHPMDFPRGCVFVGTTNKHQYLKDDTGNRRYWPIRTGEINLELLREDRDQLWAEAVVRYLAHNRYDVLGSSRWWFDPSIEPELVACAEFEQSERYMSDPWDRKIESWLKSRAASPGEDYPSTTVNDILRSCLQKEVADWTHQDQVRVSRALRLAKWTRYYASPNDERRREWRYRPIGAHGQVKVAGG